MKNITKLLIAAVFTTVLSAFTATGLRADSITLTQSNLELTGSYTTNTEKTVEGITFVYTDLMKSSNNIQAKASSGVIYNTTPFPGTITSVVITHSGTARSTTVLGSSDGTNWTQVATGSGSIDADFSASSYTYFKITRGANAAYWTQIEITYSSGSSTPTCAVPTFSPAQGTYTSAQNVTISTETEGATIYYTLDGTAPTVNSSVYSSAISVSETTTIKAIAVKDGNNNSAVASATYTIQTPITISAVRAQGTGSVFTQGIVTSCAGTTAYIQDANAAVCVYGQALTVGDEVTVQGTLTTYKGLLEITSPTVNVLSSGNTVLPTVKTIAEINTDYAADNELQGWLIKIENATVTAISGSNTTIAQGNNTIVVRNITEDISVDDVITLTGNIGCFDAAQIANPTDVSVVMTCATPTFSPAAGVVVSGTEVSLSTATDDATIYYTTDGSTPTSGSTEYSAPISVTSSIIIKAIAVKDGYTDSDVAEAAYTVASPAATPTFSPAAGTYTSAQNVVISCSTEDSTIYYTIDGSTPTTSSSVYSSAIAVSETMTIKAIAVADGFATSEVATALFTINIPQVVWDLSTDQTATATDSEMTWTSDYVTMGVEKGTATTATNNYYPGTSGKSYSSTRFYAGSVLTIAPKAGYAITSVIFTATTENYATVLRNENNWTNGSTSGTGTTVIITPDKGNTSMVASISATCGFSQAKVYYEIDNSASITLSETTLNASCNKTDGTIEVSYVNIENVLAEVILCDSEGNDATYDWFDAEIDNENNVSYTILANTGDARTAYFKVYALDDEANDVYSSIITVNQAEYVAPIEPGDWELVDIANISANDVFVIVGTNATGSYALSNDQGTSSAPSAVSVTVLNNTLSGSIADNIQWTISGNAEDGYVFYPNDSNSSWLYCTNDNNGLRVGTGSNSAFKIQDDYLFNMGQSRYIGIYNNADWRSYTSINNNITNQTFSFYKKAAPDGAEETINLTGTLSEGRYWATFYNATAQYALSEGAEAFTMNSSNQLYRLGTDGKLIPENTAVIIISDKAAITLTQKNSGKASINGTTNILQGSATAVTVSGISGTPYVLGIPAGKAIGFYQFTGETIPANKAYYVVTE